MSKLKVQEMSASIRRTGDGFKKLSDVQEIIGRGLRRMQ